ncbi:MAG: cupin domain-containing protein [Chitinophagaceae bacterium]|nr:MAG: cupin domain-containing protein [Chitinophagaceae bacterium]
MNYTFPHILENGQGERIVFQGIDGERLYGETFCQPGAGPIMHCHLKQDEGLTVVSGRIGYQVLGEEPKFAGPGESVVFERGVAHRFWADGDQPLHCKAWIEPVNTFLFFLTSIFAAQKKSGTGRPELFDAAYLTTRYASEYRLEGIPPFVRKVMIPVTYRVGKVLGKYKHFKNAPEPIR